MIYIKDVLKFYSHIHRSSSHNRTVTTKTAFAAASNNNSGNTVTIEECKNKGSSSGFNTALDQECENLICTHPGDGATCVSENEGATISPVGNQTNGGGEDNNHEDNDK